MTKLVAIFKTSGGRSQTWSYPSPNESLSNQEMRGILEKFTLLNLFKKDDEKLYNQITSAKYVETVERIIF
ncbi:hypothetical protein IGI39_003059 [Enterococcus sp. AZ135]|uniref:DUF2922 domain-containing protein n=1 Tax=unclassified Enterococcus TaxID=2608891 RepID=UPI003F2996E5